MNQLILRTGDQLLLFQHEIIGQLSDGWWENSRPFGHWKSFAGCDVVVGGTGVPIGRTFYQVRKYDLLKLMTNECVKERMLKMIRIKRKLGDRIFDSDCSNIVGSGFKSLIEYSKSSGNQNYYKEILRRTLPYVTEIEQAMEDILLYSEKELRRDLREIKLAMNTKL